jgi:hypothetical protein
VPHWHEGNGSLQLDLPQHVADACDGIRLEIGGVLLPRACTQQLSLRRLSEQGPCPVYQVIKLQHIKSLLYGAQLLPCRAVPSEGFQAEQDNTKTPTGQEDSLEQYRSRLELVLCAQWPAAPVGQQVRSCMGQRTPT